MNNRISDKEVLQLLSNLKDSDDSYPQDMIESRRGNFTRQAAAMAALLNAGASSTNLTGAGQTVSTASTASSSGLTAGIGGVSMGKVLEALLVIAILAEAGAVAYVYREKIVDFFNSLFGPNVEEVEIPADISPLDIIPTAIPSMDIPDVTVTVPISVPVNETLIPPEVIPSVQTDSGGSQPAFTPTPAPTNDDNGLHLGQTKQPTNEPNKNEK
ncbi:MAG TPA: hypothetical protein VK851_13340 [Anaerolineales bacterium]|nr:hypothetical protein [Anaerolineales bacterium]